MLILHRRLKQRLIIRNERGETLTIIVDELSARRCRLAIEGPKSFAIERDDRKKPDRDQ